MSGWLIFIAITGALLAGALGVVVGRLVTLKGFTWTLKDAIGVLLILAFIGVLFLLFWKEIPPKNEQLIVYMLGQLSGFVGGVISSHFVAKAGEGKLEEKREETRRLQAEAAVTTANVAAAALPSEPGKPDIELEPGESATIAAGDDKGAS